MQNNPLDIIIWYIEKKYYFVGIEPIRDVELTCIFQNTPPFVSCIEDMSQYYYIKF